MTRFLKGLKSYAKDDLGAAAVEFALVSTAFIALLFGMIEGGRMMMAQNSLQFAIEETARYVMINDAASPLSDTDIKTRIAGHMNNMAFFVDPSTDLSNITITRPSGENGVTFIQIAGSYTYKPLIPTAIPSSWLNLKASARIPIQP